MLFKIIRTILVASCCFVAAGSSIAHEHNDQGIKLAKITLADQFDESKAIDATTKIVLFAHDMTGNDLIEEALSDFDNQKLDAKKAVYIADISGMPSLIAKLFAIPSMRDRAYSIMLDKEGDVTAKFERKEDKVTIFYLDKEAITKTAFASTTKEIAAVLAE